MVVFDLDDVLADCKWHKELGGKYHEGVRDGTFCVRKDMLQKLNNCLKDNKKVVIVTSRPESLRGDTERWVRRNIGDIPVYMCGNSNKVDTIKRLNLEETVEVVYDDREDIISAVAGLGIKGVLVD